MSRLRPSQYAIDEDLEIHHVPRRHEWRGYSSELDAGGASARDAPANGLYKWPPVIKIPNCSSVASGDTISTILPSYMTAIRSDSERISSSSAETSSTALPASRSSIRRR